jgi:hypothetical protein
MAVNPIRGSAPVDIGSGVYPSLGNPLSGPTPSAAAPAGKRERPIGSERGKPSKAHPARTLPGRNPTPRERDIIWSRGGLPDIRKRPIG